MNCRFLYEHCNCILLSFGMITGVVLAGTATAQ